MIVPASKPLFNGSIRPLGAFYFSRKIYLMFRDLEDDLKYYLAESDDGLNFDLLPGKGQIIENKIPLNLQKISGLHFCQVENELYLVFNHHDHVQRTYFAKFNSLLKWTVMSQPVGIAGSGVISPAVNNEREFSFYGGVNDIKLAISNDLVKWTLDETSVLSRAENESGNESVTVQTAVSIPKGILLLYQSFTKGTYFVSAIIFDKEEPDQVLWRSSDWIWKSIPEWQGRQTKFVGAVHLDGKIISYWHVEGEGIYAVVYLHLDQSISVQSKNISLRLDKPKANPIISPRPDKPWEAFNTFNPAAIYESGKVHILYRAQGYDYSSVVGYASSTDGITICERLDHPCYVPKEQFEATGTPSSLTPGFMSGGGYGGCEDPRLTRIGDRIYMSYVAFNGSSEPRIALTSISVTDFLDHRWFWSKPVLISPPGVIDKSATVFPEKIGGKYVILHRVFPNILLDFVDNLEFDGSTWLKGEYQIKIRPDHWDSRKIGAGAPPIRTKDGWLLIYYSVDERDAGRYKIGAMLLDLDDPRKVLHRTNNPILEPNERYENEGFKAGVSYPCGAVVIGPTLFVYYGAADTYVCVATADLNDFLAELKFAELAKLEPAFIQMLK